MKKSVYIILVTALLAACGSEDNSSLAELRTERDSLVAIQQSVKEQIKLIDDKLAKLDTTKKLSLVTAMEVKPSSFNHYFKVYGTVESNKAITIMSEASGKIKAIKVERGQRVNKGQLLAQIDASVLLSTKEELITSLDLAEEIYNKQHKLWVEEKIGSEVQYLEAKNNKESLERKLETVNAQIAMTQIKAPFSGVIDDVFPKVGEMASPQMSMFRLVNLSSVYLTADVSEYYVGKVRPGTKALVNFTNVDEELESSIVQVGSFINPDNRTFKVDVSLEDAKNTFKPNMMASIDINDYSKDSTIVLSSRIVQETTTGESFVYVLNNVENNVGVVERIIVKTGPSHKDKIEITEGLKGNEMVIDRGSRSVKKGQKVRLVEE